MRLQDPTLNQDKQEEIREFSDWVLKLGEGRLRAKAVHENDEDNWIQIPEDLLLKQIGNPIDAIISSTYPDIESMYCIPNYLKDRCILTPTNDCAHEVNTKILKRLPHETKKYPSADTISPVSSDVRDQDILYPTEYLNTLTLSGIPNHMLELKEGVPIMLMRNINPSRGMCNGTRLIVTKLQERIIQAKIITGSHVGDPVAIHRILMSSTPTKWPFILRRRQFPVKVCFSMTINKSQGQTLQKVGLYLPNPVFSHGQLYVAASRTTSREGLKILIDKTKKEPEGYTQNVVYQEIFNNLPAGINAYYLL
ncbi:DNA helicase [Ranunculus cassubicifolius]